MADNRVRQRVWLFQVVVVVAFVALTAQLWRIQVLGGANYQLLSRENSVAQESIEAARGVIYDRQGRILVRNRPHFRATLLPAHVLNETWLLWTEAEWEQVAGTLGRMAGSLGMPFPTEGAAGALQEAFDNTTGQMLVEDIGKLCQAGKLLECYAEALVTAPYDAITIQRGVPTDVAFIVMENHVNLPGLAIVPESQRQYLYGPLYSHLLGYALPITQEQLDRQTRFTTNPYLATDRVGATGIEYGFEANLRGVRGLRRVEENVVGRRVRVLEEIPSVPGHNVFLTVDTDLQVEVAAALEEGMARVNSPEGVAIVMKPKTGEVLAMVSLPTYDNNLFVGDINMEQFAQLSTDPAKPMFNRAISGVYPPGSIYKIIPAAGGLADGIINRHTSIFDPGMITIPNENAPDDPELAQDFVCWLRSGHGEETVVDALAHSCDVFFYEVGGGYLDEFRGLGIDALAKWSTAFGLGELTRIDLPGEAAGLVPTRQWKRLVWQRSWLKGDTYNMSIGQGDLLVTPLQILNATTAIANGGLIYEPQVVYQVQDAEGNVVQSFEPRVLRHVNVSPDHLAIVAEGMLGATTWEDGTARLVFQGAPVRVAGKTGTAEYCERYLKPDGTPDCKLDPEGHQLTHAWFSAFAPYEDPEIALLVFIHGNRESVIQGSEVAAPVARRIIDYYFTRRPLERAEPVVPAAPPPTPTFAATITAPQSPVVAPPATQPIATPLPPKPEPTLPPPPTRAGAGRYVGTLVRSEGLGESLSVVSGRVVDAQGNPMSGVQITVDGGGAPVATLHTGPDGSFRYDLLDPNQAMTWYVRAAALPGAPFVALTVATPQHHIVLFQEEP